MDNRPAPVLSPTSIARAPRPHAAPPPPPSSPPLPPSDSPLFDFDESRDASPTHALASLRPWMRNDEPDVPVSPIATPPLTLNRPQLANSKSLSNVRVQQSNLKSPGLTRTQSRAEGLSQASTSPPTPWGQQAVLRDVSSQLRTLEDLFDQLKSQVQRLNAQLAPVQQMGLRLDQVTQRVSALTPTIQGLDDTLVKQQKNLHAQAKQMDGLRREVQQQSARLQEIEREGTLFGQSLPASWRWVYTSDGLRLAMSEATRARLQQHVPFFEVGPRGDVEGSGDLLFDAPRPLLATLATWAQGLLISEPLIGKDSLWRLRQFAAQHRIAPLRDNASQEITAAAENAAHHVLRQYERGERAQPYLAAMQQQMIAAIHEGTHVHGQVGRATLRVAVGTTPISLAVNQKLSELERSGRAGPWATDVARALDAFGEYLDYQQAGMDAEPTFDTSPGGREATLVIRCRYAL